MANVFLPDNEILESPEKRRFADNDVYVYNLILDVFTNVGEF